MDKEVIRVQLDLKKQHAEMLDRLVDQTGAASRAEVVRKALLLLSEVHGKKLELVEPDGTRVGIILI
jgi:Arc/MetJ-type ribon-helix-helix transcriptional regulator